MKLQAILDGIQAQGLLEIDRIQKEAQRQIDEINQAAEKNAGQQRLRILADGRARLNREIALINQQAAVRALQIHADARQKLIQEVLDAVRENLPSIRKRKDYKDILSRMIEDVMDSLSPSLLEGQSIILHFDPRDRDLVQALLQKRGQQTDILFDEESSGGCVGETSDALVITRNTIESRFERAHQILQQSLSVFFEEKVSSG